MKKIKSFLLIAFVIILSTVSVVFADEAPFEYDKDSLKEEVTSLFQVYTELSDEEIEFILENNSYTKALQSGAETYQGIKDTLGEFDKISDVKFKVIEDSVVVTAVGDFKNATVDMKVEFKELFGEVTICNISFELAEVKDGGLGEKMYNALLNTLLGLGTVFIVLILIAFIISLFKYTPKFEAWLAKSAEKKEKRKLNRKNKKNKADNAVDNTIAQIVAKEEAENLVDDLELVAVIAAAIAEYEGTSTDSFVVRSINRANSKKWRNA